MRRWKRKQAWVAVSSGLLVLAFHGVGQAQRRGSERNSENQNSRGSQTTAAEPTPPVPPYFKSVKQAEPLPAVLPAAQFKDRPVVERAYALAGRIPRVLAQQPCYCGCDVHFQHHSLLDCYASEHTAGCAVCVKEGFLAYEMTRAGKTPAQIRAAIIRGDWKKVDLNHPPDLKP